METTFKVFDGRVYCNTTPHPITLQAADGQTCVIPPCGVLLNADPMEKAVPSPIMGIVMVKTVFQPTAEGLDFLAGIPRHTVVIGSIIAAQAYPGRVLAMVPVPGFERVPPAEKRMMAAKFTTF